jgi:hypothetical protein
VVRDGAASGAEVLQVRGAEWLAAARALSSRCGLVVHQQQRRQQLAGCTMPAPKPKAWGWKVIKYYHLKGLTDPNEIVRHMRGKGMRVGRTWVQDRLRKYREDGDPNSRDARTDARRATTPERRWLKRTLQNDCALLFDQLRRKFHRRFKWWISKHMISAALKTAGPVSPGDQLDRPLSLKKIERIAKQRNEVSARPGARCCKQTPPLWTGTRRNCSAKSPVPATTVLVARPLSLLPMDITQSNRLLTRGHPQRIMDSSSTKFGGRGTQSHTTRG